MNKQEFLEKLRLSLNGKVPAGVVTENINYYEDYINTEIRKGKSEEEVLVSLGDPRLIARTIVETRGGRAEQASDFRESGDYSGQEREGYQDFGHVDESRHGWVAKIPGWVWLVLFIIVAVIILSAVFHVIAFFAPALIVIAVVMFLVKLFRDWIN
ncbi:MAG: DUF1700 domain-containing protein [Acetatifactor sp.]